MRHFITDHVRDRLIAACLVLAVWHCLSLAYSPLVVPPIHSVLARLAGIVTAPSSYAVIGVTMLRLAAGLALGIGAGVLLGVMFGRWRGVNALGVPILGLVQAVPPVSWLVLAFIWFGFDGRPSVFIVALSVLPILTANTVEGMRAVDQRLLDVARVYRFSRRRTLRLVWFPSMMPYFRSALRIAVGTGCKAVVMGEVLTTGNGIGGAITAARMNLEPEAVIAWSLLIVAAYYCLDLATSRLLAEPRRRRC